MTAARRGHGFETGSSVEICVNPCLFPIPYEVCYNPGEIEENHTYTMQARIEDSAGNLLYINDTSNPVAIQPMM